MKNNNNDEHKLQNMTPKGVVYNITINWLRKIGAE